jgi:hypothetical protein
MVTLNQLGIKYHTDKSTLLHNYLNEYEKLFPNPNEVKNVCEIGLQRGGAWRLKGKELPSVNMWLEFFPNCQFYGFDLKELTTTNKRATIIQGDQNQTKDLRRLFTLLPNDMDFIIDDGSHYADHQFNTFETLWTKVKKGGVYIIEDCNALVQKDLPTEKRIHSLIEPYLKLHDHVWIDSDSAGSKSSLAIIK